MSKESVKTLISEWVQGKLTLQRAVGQMLQHLLEIERRLEEAEHRLRRERSEEERE